MDITRDFVCLSEFTATELDTILQERTEMLLSFSDLLLMKLRFQDDNTFWPLIQLSVNLRDLEASIQLCVGQRLAGDKATIGTKMEPDSCVRWKMISKHIHRGLI